MGESGGGHAHADFESLNEQSLAFAPLTRETSSPQACLELHDVGAFTVVPPTGFDRTRVRRGRPSDRALGDATPRTPSAELCHPTPFTRTRSWRHHARLGDVLESTRGLPTRQHTGSGKQHIAPDSVSAHDIAPDSVPAFAKPRTRRNASM
jgi:hypothetical protein